MMKKLFVGLLIVSLLLASCSSDEEEEIVLEDPLMDAEVPAEEEPVDEPVVEPESEEPEEEETESESTVSFSAADVLLEKRIGEYDYKRSSSVSDKELYDYEFANGHKATYSYGRTKAEVYVLYNIDGNLISFLGDNLEDNDFELLDSEELSYIEDDVYFNPYENIYVWMSRGKIVVIEHSIGDDLLLKYLREHPTSVIIGTYEDEEVALSFEEDEEKLIFLNENQYIIELKDMDSSAEEITLVVNNEESVFENNEISVAGNLLIRITSFNFNERMMSLEIEREVFEKESFELNLNEPVEFEMNGQSNTMKLTGANSDSSTVIINLNDVTKTFEEGQVRSIDNVDVKLDGLFINTIGVEQVIAAIEVWPSD
ncbi:hypothetical protein HQ533_06185 [Candidatus Woesearchaeota archaeon]|nr:hypothetical protein [Candidatus Woesearchaeota archaeon]